MIGAIQTALSGLKAASTRIEASAENIANIDTVGTLDGSGRKPYAAQTTVQQALQDGQGVAATNVAKSPAFVPSYAPGSPFANADGLVGAPNVDLGEEAVNQIIAKTAYKANALTIKTASEMQDDLLKILDKKA